MKKSEDFPISSKTGERLVSACEKYRVPGDTSDFHIYVNLSMVRLQTAWFLPKLLYAAGAARVLHCKVSVITWRPNALFRKLVTAMGMEHLCLEEMNRRDIRALFRALGRTVKMMADTRSGEKLKRSRVLGIPVGKALYEDILRTSELSTIKRITNITCIKKIFHLLWTFFAFEEYLKKNPVKLGIIDDIAYHESALAMLMRKRGGRIVNVSPAAEEIIAFRKDLSIVRRGERVNRYLHQQFKGIDLKDSTEVERFLEQRFRGVNIRQIDKGAFAQKKVLGRMELEKELGLDSNKKNVVIMAHTFSDAVFNYGDIYFRDYYDWLETTLEIAETVSSVNWILKPHPTRKAYHESADSVEAMFERHKKDNIFFLDDSISAESIRDFADVLITIGGNAGAEFACFGIPAVIVGKPYYKGFGYTIEPADAAAYRKVLESIDEIGHLDEEQTKTAQKVFYIRNVLEESDDQFKDEFADLINREYEGMISEMALSYFEKNDGTGRYNDIITDKIVAYMDSHDMSECEYYRRGCQRGKEMLPVEERN